MRKLTEIELEQVKKAIASKELTSAEILIEVYDHYVSHLESFQSSEFEKEFSELEQRFKYSYYKRLQKNFEKTTKKEILNAQWLICKSYFSWPKIIITILILICLAIILENLDGKTKLYALAIFMGLTVLLVTLIGTKSFLKVRSVKNKLGITSKIESSFLNYVKLQFSCVISFFNLFVLMPKLLFESPIWFESRYFVITSFLLCLFYIGYLTSLFEAWKIKSKNFLV